MALEVTTTDDRGTPVKIGPGRWLHAVETGDGDPQLLALVLGINQQLQLASLNRRTVIIFVLMIVGAATAHGVILATVAPKMPMWILPVSLGVGMSVWFSLRARWGLKRLGPNVRLTMLNEGRCPSCSHQIHACPVQEDGCVVCPECGAAWRNEAIGTHRVSRASRPTPTPTHSVWHQAMFAKSVMDGGGRIVPMVDPMLRRLPHQRAESLGVARIRSVRKRVSRHGRKGRLLLVGMVGLSGMVILLGAINKFASLPAPGSAGWRVYVAPLGLVLLVLTVGWACWMLARGPFGTPRERIAMDLTEEGVCPGCAADLGQSGERMQETGNVQCRECGSEWKVAVGGGDSGARAKH